MESATNVAMSTNPSLTDVLARREIKAKERDAKREELMLLDEGIKELDDLIEALTRFAQLSSGRLSGLTPHTADVTSDTAKEAQPVRGRRNILGYQNSPKTTRDLIVGYLSSTPSLWRTTEDVKFNISEIKGSDVPMGTVGPTLSNMKNKGEIVRDGNKVALAERVRLEQPEFFNENGEPDGSPEVWE